MDLRKVKSEYVSSIWRDGAGLVNTATTGTRGVQGHLVVQKQEGVAGGDPREGER